MATTRHMTRKAGSGKSIMATLKDGFDYGQNPDKTRNGDLVMAYECDPRTADAEFLLSKAKYKAITGREQKKERDVSYYHQRQAAKRRRQILDGTWEPGNFVRFSVTERGKTRPIDAPHINDRQIHKAICQNALFPLYAPSMIYDNGASLPGKGLHFALRRIKEQLRWHYRRHGRAGAVFLLDFHHFFPSAPHAALYERHRRLIQNEGIRKVADAIVASAPGGVGMPLGVEPSQVEMVSLPSSIDNYIKRQLGIHCAGHYMDDYYLILPDREHLERVANEVIRRAEAMGLTVNRAKCKIIPLTKPWRFCKAKFTLTETGAVKMNGAKASMKRARRKLKAFHKKVVAGEMTLADVDTFMQSQIAYFENYDDHGRVLKLRRLHYALFIRPETNQREVQPCIKS